MRKLISTRRRKLVGIVTLLIAAACVAGAWAYFSGQGNGTADPATVGHAPAPLNLAATVEAINLYPGGSSAAVDITITNATSGDVSDAGTITGSVQTTLNGDVTGYPGCSGSWFVFDNVSVPGVTLAASDTDSAVGSLRMIESGTNQDACSDAQPVLNLSLNGG